MMTDALEIRLSGEIGFGRDLRQALETAQPSIARAMRAYEQDGRLCVLDVEIDHRSVAGEATIVALAGELLQTLAGAPTIPPERRHESRALAELRLRRSWTTAEPAIEVRLRSANDAQADPAGIVLIDAPGPLPSSDADIATWAAVIANSLATNVMARADAEYALAVDLPLAHASEDRIGRLTDALTLAGNLAAVLPSDVPGAPNLLDLRVRAGPVVRAGATPRVRIWRLGIMKVRTDTRVA